MATIISLSGDEGPLTKVSVPLKPREQPVRTFYATGTFMSTFLHDLPNWRPGRLAVAELPSEQMDNMLHRWITGREMHYGRALQDLMPRSDEVWEMKSADLRIFGWIYVPCVFVAAKLGYADEYKGKRPKKLYRDAVQDVVSTRDALDLDPPKFATGNYDALV